MQSDKKFSRLRFSLSVKSCLICIFFGIINIVTILYVQDSFLKVYDPSKEDVKCTELVSMPISESPSISNSDTRGESESHLEPKLPELAVIHMGVHKTGSSSIQDMSKVVIDELLQDGYEMPWVNPPVEKSYIGPNQVYFSECFTPSGDESKKYGCTPELLISGTQIAQRQNNIFISAESFVTIEGDNINSLKAYLSQWKHTKIVVYYRHYFDYLRSKYNQGVKKRKFDDEKAFETNLLLYLTRFANLRYPYFTVPLVHRLRDHFDDIVVVDYHDQSKNLVEAFYCDVLPGASNTCKAIRDANSDEGMSANESVDLAYGDLAWAAKKQGLIEIANDEQMDKLCEEIKAHIKESLGKTTKEMPQECLSLGVLNDILETSLKFQSEMFPNADGKDLRTMFEESKPKLCILDTEATLEDEKWQEFFKDFKYD